MLFSSLFVFYFCHNTEFDLCDTSSSQVMKKLWRSSLRRAEWSELPSVRRGCLILIRILTIIRKNYRTRSSSKRLRSCGSGWGTRLFLSFRRKATMSSKVTLECKHGKLRLPNLCMCSCWESSDIAICLNPSYLIRLQSSFSCTIYFVSRHCKD